MGRGRGGRIDPQLQSGSTVCPDETADGSQFVNMD